MAVITLTKANFKQTVENNPFVIVDFWAPWCDPCMLFTEVFKQVSENHPDIVFGMVDTEIDPEISEYFNVEKIPGIMVIRDQASILTQVGELGGQALEEIIKWARNYEMGDVHTWYAEQDTKGKTAD
jgi:thioredoxin 1